MPPGAVRAAALLLALLLGSSSVAPAAAARRLAGGVSLDRDVGTPPVYAQWDYIVNTWNKDPQLTPLLSVLREFQLPSAQVAIQFNTLSDTIWHTGQQFDAASRNPKYWWAAGFGVPYNAPMRVASVSKPITAAVWRTPALAAWLDKPFYAAWETYVGDLPEPLDARVKAITPRHLLAHTSGFSNAAIGFDPAFQGKSVAMQIGGILTSTMLTGDPGSNDSYSNFGYMILARLAAGIRRRSWSSLVRGLFPAGAPVFSARDTLAWPATNVSAAEVGIYYVQKPDTQFDASVMAGNGAVVSNAVTLSWFGTNYWVGGVDLVGKKLSAAPSKPGQEWSWIMDGSMPGTLAALVQYVNPQGRVASACIITNTRVPDSGDFLDKINGAALTMLQTKFKDL
ncbi:fimD [Scenedesmus sp. PABB004]|nr:fimD [Scenedesmus sp. PABB004]